MKNSNLEDDDLDDLDFLEDITEPIFHQDIMVQNIDKKRTITLPSEISRRKKMIKRMFDVRFGKVFFKFKPESLIIFENQLKQYYFSPNSKFLYNFPRLRKKLLFDKKINYDKLYSKINVGSLLYLSETEKKKTKKDKIDKKENIITFSKNFATQQSKDYINNHIYKIKFWNKNSRRIKRFLSKRINNNSNKNLNNNSILEEEEEEKKYDNNKLYSKTSNNFNNIKNNKFNNYSSVQKNGNNINYNNNNNNTQNFILKLSDDTDNTISNSYYNNIKLYNINKSIKKNKNIKSIDESSLPSFSVKKNKNNDEGIDNINKLKIKIISRNDKKLKQKSTHNHSTYQNLNNNSKKELINTYLKYKKNLNKQVKELNSHTIKCNYKLCNIIDGNYTIKSTEKIKKKNNEFDISNDLYDNNKKKDNTKKNKSFFDYYELEKIKLKNNKNKINSLIKEAKNNISQQDKFKKRELKLFPKKIFKMKDEYALKMVERLYSAHKINREKVPEIKEVIKEDRENKQKNKIITLRKKAKFNHEKILKMGLFLTKEKEKFFNIK